MKVFKRKKNDSKRIIELLEKINDQLESVIREDMRYHNVKHIVIKTYPYS